MSSRKRPLRDGEPGFPSDSAPAPANPSSASQTSATPPVDPSTNSPILPRPPRRWAPPQQSPGAGPSNATPPPVRDLTPDMMQGGEGGAATSASASGAGNLPTQSTPPTGTGTGTGPDVSFPCHIHRSKPAMTHAHLVECRRALHLWQCAGECLRLACSLNVTSPFAPRPLRRWSPPPPGTDAS